MAYDETNYLVGIQDTSDNSIGAQLISKAGSLVGSLISTGRIGQKDVAPNVAFDGTNYLLVWNEDIAGQDIYGQFIKKAGDLLGSLFPITTSNGGDDEYALVFDGSNYLVVYKNSTTLRISAKFITPDGFVGDEYTLSIDEGQEPVVAFDGTNFLVAWYKSNPGTDVYGQLISRSGTPVGSEFVIDANSFHSSMDHSIAFDGTNYLVTFHDDIDISQQAEEWDIFGRFVDTSGNVGSRITISNESGNQLCPKVAFNGNYYLITWTDFPDWPDFGNFTSFGRFFDTAGNPIGSKFSITFPGNGTSPFIGSIRFDSDSNKYLIVVTTGISDTINDVYGLFITP